ncbi:MAG: (d)CMP kinase, partial [Flavobacteriaceae bacterium]|nr:(d)CMP kinase [Flavobacteriaceae bacterium]
TERDFIDSNRADSPLVKAQDALEIDNSHKTVEEQLTLIYSLIKDKVN